MVAQVDFPAQDRSRVAHVQSGATREAATRATPLPAGTVAPAPVSEVLPDPAQALAGMADAWVQHAPAALEPSVVPSSAAFVARSTGGTTSGPSLGPQPSASQDDSCCQQPQRGSVCVSSEGPKENPWGNGDHAQVLQAFHGSGEPTAVFDHVQASQAFHASGEPMADIEVHARSDMNSIERSAHVGSVLACAGLGFTLGFTGCDEVESLTMIAMGEADVSRKHRIAETAGYIAGLLARVFKEKSVGGSVKDIASRDRRRNGRSSTRSSRRSRH